MSYARHLPVLMYHHVSDKPGQITLSPRTFRAQMKWLAESGWKNRYCCRGGSFLSWCKIAS